MIKFKDPNTTLAIANVLLIVNGSESGSCRGWYSCCVGGVLGRAAATEFEPLGWLVNGLSMVNGVQAWIALTLGKTQPDQGGAVMKINITDACAKAYALEPRQRSK